jgi:hypothetical protein
MYKYLLLGPVLSAVTYGAGAYYGADAEQLVHKSPDTVYAALSNMVEGSPEREASLNGDDGRRIKTDLKLAASDPGKSMSIQLLLDGQPGASADVSLTPQEDGKATLVAVKLHGDHAVLRDRLAGSSQARLAYAPDWLLNLTFRPVLRALGEDIEKEQGFASISGTQSEADWEAKLSPGEQQQVAQWRQYESTQPTVDPDAAAQNYMSSSGSN